MPVPLTKGIAHARTYQPPKVAPAPPRYGTNSEAPPQGRARDLTSGFATNPTLKNLSLLSVALLREYVAPIPLVKESATPRMRALTIEDDRATASLIAEELALHGHEVTVTSSGPEGLAHALTERFDVITLDRMLPELDGLSIVRILRERGVSTPVLMISALSDVDDRINGLRAGGDDYLIKPFAPEEMIARIEVLLRRRGAATTNPAWLKSGELELDLVAREARVRDRVEKLRERECKLLEFLMRNAGEVLSRRLIFEEVWGYFFDPGDNLINVHIGTLRRKLEQPGEPPLIETVRGQGYRLIRRD